MSIWEEHLNKGKDAGSVARAPRVERLVSVKVIRQERQALPAMAGSQDARVGKTSGPAWNLWLLDWTT